MTKKYAKHHKGRKGRSRRVKGTANLTKTISPFPDRTLVRLKYTERVQSNGTAMDYVWNLNSIFDPNLTGTGHQPLGRDQWAGVYNRYRVYKVHYNIRALCDGATERWFAYAINNDTTAFTNFDQLCESSRSRSMPLVNQKPLTLKGTSSLPKVNGRTRAEYMADDRYQATMGTSPAETICLHLGYINAAGTTVAANAITMDVTFYFYVELFDAIQLTQS